jgi:HK97 family phage major capsid protein
VKPTLKDARASYNGAVEAMEAAATAIEEADESADLEPLQAAFQECLAEVEQAKAELDRLQALVDARRDHPRIADDGDPAGEITTEDGVPVSARITGTYPNGETAGLGDRGYAFAGTGSTTRVRVVREPLTYERSGPHSFVWDMYSSRQGGREAQERLARHAHEMFVERAALNETAGTGGEFVPPLWMQDEWIRLARAGRPFANAVNRRPLPPNTNSINFPSVSTGAATAAQADGGAVQSTDPGTGSLSVAVKTIAGQVDLARQLLDRSVPGMDEVLFDDLARDYATKLDVQCINGSGAGANALGILNVAGIKSVTYTSGSPTAYAAWQAIAQAISQVSYARYLTPNVVVMHPRRWFWLISALDTQNRPLVVPADQAGINTLALFDTVGAENLVGRVMGLPVIIDASVPTTLGSGTNEDRIIVTRTDDVWLFEDEAPRMRVYEEVLSGNLQIRVQVYGYFAFTAGRYPSATGVISGTGLAAPAGY